MSNDAEWYKDAVIYQVHVKAYADSNGDGTGDIDGLTAKLDYIQQLGVTAVWLLPFYPSPLRDDGYDIADYDDVNPMYGDMAAFRRFLREAHRRDLKVITELVINHTSDEHAWFQRARRSPKGSNHRDYYVWSDTDTPYAETRIIFEDFETSNWTWDPVAGQYFWHRFYSHQPDLNFDHPAVHREVFRAMDRWLAMGVDGIRLDAIPYLYEREGTNCENLPETHQFLKQLRARMDEKFPNRMFLAEANQWPEDAVEYFGDGDECHMAFHFPVMPRLYMAVEMEDSRPITDILAQTPAIPDTCQWAMFLRNHDELTLEMVTDEERVKMRRAYAPDPRMRINLGIRRRLAPLMQNDRRRIELMNILLFSMPGTPVVYYGDEIGMGDNVYLPDRDGVRTPMQWSPDRNAGFSVANPHQLYLPVIADPQYHYETVNVESQRANPASLWWWMHDLIAMRRRHPVLARGAIDFLTTDNPKVLAFRRWMPDDPGQASMPGQPSIVVVVNLSRHAQAVHVDLAGQTGATPTELFGDTTFPAIGEQPYPLTLGPYGYYWLRLDPTDAAAVTAETPDVELTVTGGRIDLEHRSTRRAVERALTGWVPSRPWFRPSGRDVRSVQIADSAPLGRRDAPGAITVVEVTFTNGDRDRYVVPVSVVRGDAATALAEAYPDRVLATVGQRGLLIDAMTVPAAVGALSRAAAGSRPIAAQQGELRPWHTSVSAGRGTVPGEVNLVGNEERTTIALVGDVVVELRRLVTGGISTDTSLTATLRAAGFLSVAPVVGRLDYHPRRGEPSTMVVTHAAVAHDGDMYSVLGGLLRNYFDESRARQVAPAPIDLFATIDDTTMARLHTEVGPSVELAAELADTVAELHHALIVTADTPPRPFTSLYQRSLYQAMSAAATDLRRAGLFDRLPADTAQRLAARIDELRGPKLEIVRTRIHGNLHLGRMLWNGHEAVLVDIAGDVTTPVEMRLILRSPLRDVARMLTSFDELAADVVAQVVERTPTLTAEELQPWLTTWVAGVSAVFWQRYRQRIAELCPTVAIEPADPDAARRLLDLYRFARLADAATHAVGSDRSAIAVAALERLVTGFPA